MGAQMHTMEFLNPTFVNGLNLTVRLGDKWKKANPGDSLLLVKTGEADGRPGFVEDVIITRFSTLERYSELIKLNHDPECRTVMGLINAMKKSYGEQFSLDAQVALVLFWA
jgi:hypothetical protein